MTKEEQFKNKAIERKIKESFGIIIILYLGSTIYSCIALAIMTSLSIEQEPQFLIGTIIFLAVIAVISVMLTRKGKNYLQNT